MNLDKQNTLIIPKGLLEYKGAKQLFEYNNNSTIIYKDFDFDLINIEFYTQTYCIVYNCMGRETITSYDFESVTIGNDELLFLPKDMYLVSDFIKTNKSLKAFLFFFNDDIIDKFLSTKKLNKKILESKVNFYKMEVSDAIVEYINSITTISKNQYKSKYFLELKLLELLHIIDSTDKDNKLVQSFLTRNINKEKRNIESLMKQHYLNNFTMKDYALLSGRSLSTFHRDFKSNTNMTPKQYLLNLKLEYANKALIESEKSVSAISYEIGYENISHFIKAFKNRYKITPKQLSKTII